MRPALNATARRLAPWVASAALSACSDGGASVRQCSATLGYPAPPAEFRETRAGAIVTHWQSPAPDAQAQTARIAEHRAWIRQRLGEVLALPDTTIAHVYVYRSAAEKASHFPCKGASPNVIAGAADRNEVHHDRVSFHELVHLYTLREPGRAWSQLFNEGLALYLGDLYATSAPGLPPSDLSKYAPFEAELVRRGEAGWPSLAHVHEWKPNDELTEDERVVRYLVAGSFVRYLFETFGDDRIVGYLRESAGTFSSTRDAAHLASLERATGESLVALDAKWRAWVKQSPR
jgi:hypothetical protein